MKITQVFDIINQATDDAGLNVTVKDTSGIVSFGKTLLIDDNAQMRDNFFKKLIDRIGRTVIEERRYIGNKLGLRKEPFEYGAILQKIHVEPMRARKNNSWDLNNGDVVQIGEVYKATVDVKLWNEVDTWEVDITIVEEQIKSAFLNAEALAAFIASIFAKIEDSLAWQYEKLEELVFCTMIANALHATDDEGHHFLKVNLSEIVFSVIGLNPSQFEVESSGYIGYLTQPEIVRAIIQVINKYSLLMERMSPAFNSENKLRFTPKDRQKFVMHSDLASAISTVLKAEAFHRDELMIPEGTVVPYWQSFGNERSHTGGETTYPSEDTAIKISHNWGGDGVSSVENDYVLAVLYDVEAIGTTIDNRRIKSDVIGKGEFTNYYYKADIGYFIDPSENCIVFTWE